MKKYNSYIKGLFALSLSVLMFTSCSEDTMDKINNNDNNPKDTEAKFIIADLCTATAFRSVGGDFSTYASVYIEHEAGIHNQLYRAEKRLAEPTSNTTYNNTWNSTYENLKNAKIVIEKCSKGGSEEGSNVTLALGKIFLAYNAAILTDLFGDIPYTQAGVMDANRLPVYYTPVVDKQEDVYADIMKQLDEAIVLLDGTDAGVFGAVGTKDYIYGSLGKVDDQKAAWKKAAYGLKARYTMHLLARSANKTADLNNILSYIDKSFTSSSQEFKFTQYNGDQVNPLGAFMYSREALAASKSFVEKLNERNDPRLTQTFIDWNGVVKTSYADIATAPNGQVEEVQYSYDISAMDYSFEAATQLLSYHELLFLKAEAYARLGDSRAEQALKDAITAAFENTQATCKSVYPDALYTGTSLFRKFNLDVDLSATVSDAYYTSSVKALYDANPLKEIMIQKYLAFMGASGESVEAFNDYRRLVALNENFITLANPENAKGKLPLRFVYGNSDVLANPNVATLAGDGTYVYTEKVWWAGGIR